MSRMMAAGNPAVHEFDAGETAGAGRVVGMGDGLQCSPRSHKQQEMKEVLSGVVLHERVYSTKASYCSCSSSAGPSQQTPIWRLTSVDSVQLRVCQDACNECESNT